MHSKRPTTEFRKLSFIDQSLHILFDKTKIVASGNEIFLTGTVWRLVMFLLVTNKIPFK